MKRLSTLINDRGGNMPEKTTSSVFYDRSKVDTKITTLFLDSSYGDVTTVEDGVNDYTWNVRLNERVKNGILHTEGYAIIATSAGVTTAAIIELRDIVGTNSWDSRYKAPSGVIAMTEMGHKTKIVDNSINSNHFDIPYDLGNQFTLTVRISQYGWAAPNDPPTITRFMLKLRIESEPESAI